MIVYPKSEPPTTGQRVEIAPGIWWMRMPIQHAQGPVSVWLLADGPSWTVVDTGFGTEEMRAWWERAFAGELEGKPIGRIIATHYHPDHIGNADWLQARFSAEFLCAQAEWLTARMASAPRTPSDAEKFVAFYRSHGVPMLGGGAGHYTKLVPSLPFAYRRLIDGDELSIGDEKWKVIMLDGYSPEHTLLHCARRNLIIVGDHIMSTMGSEMKVFHYQADANPIRLYLDSLERLRVFPDDVLVLTSHGLPFRGLHERIDEIHESTQKWIATTLESVSTPKIASELIPDPFRGGDPWHPHKYAVGEVLAHLRFLEVDGRVRRETDSGGVHRFCRVSR